MERVVVDLVAPPRVSGPGTIFRSGLDVCVLVAAAEPRGPVGVWLTLSEGYPASLAARDVKTLSHLVDLSEVVLDAPAPDAAAEVVEALLDGGPVSLRNAAGELVDAYSLPVPPRPITLWRHVGATLVTTTRRLNRRPGSPERYDEVTPAAG